MNDHRANYSVIELYANGSRMVSDYSEADAVDDYLDLHPGADRAAVEAELKQNLERILSDTP